MNQPHRPLYRHTAFPVLQTRLFSSRERALKCANGNICLIQDCRSGLVRNAAFDSALLDYNGSYHKEHAHSAALQAHLSSVADLVERFVGKEQLIQAGYGKGHFVVSLPCTVPAVALRIRCRPANQNELLFVIAPDE